MFSQINGEVNWHILFQDVVNHRYNSTEVKEQGVFITTYTGTKHNREITKEVEVLAQWKEGITTWVTLKDTKNLYPVHMSEYAVHWHISGDPVFAWCIRHVLIKCNCIIGNLNWTYWVRTQNFGVKIPKSVQEAKASGKETEIPFGGTPYSNRWKISDQILKFGRKTYQRCRQDIQRLHVIWYLMSIWANTL